MTAIVSLILTAILCLSTLLPPFHLFDRKKRGDRANADQTTAKKEDPSKADAPPGKDDRPRKDAQPKKDDTAGAYEIDAFKNIAYRDDKDADPVKHKLDLFLPRGQRDFPILFFVHGGGWHSGNKEIYTAVGEVFARNGI